MIKLAKIDDEIITSDDLIKILKLNDKFKTLLEEVVGNKLTVHAAKKQGISVTDEETQERVDQYRRIFGLHRAKDMVEHLEGMGISVEEFGNAMLESLYHEKMTAKVQSEQAVEDYFKLNSPKFESVELSHMLLNSENITQEIMAILEDDADSFPELAMEHSLSQDTASKGGSLGKVYRGTLAPELEAKIFNAAAGEIVGPFGDDDGLMFEIFHVVSKYPAESNPSTNEQIKKQLNDNWLATCTNEHKVEIF